MFCTAWEKKSSGFGVWHQTVTVTKGTRLCVWLSCSQLECSFVAAQPCDSPVHNLQTASHSASKSYLTFLFLFFLLSLSLSPHAHARIHTQSGTLMPFRLASHVTNADMNFLGDKGPNYSGGLFRPRTYRFKLLSPAPRGRVEKEEGGGGGEVWCNGECVQQFCPRESVYVSLFVRVQEGETTVNTRSKCISVNVTVKAKWLLSVWGSSATSQKLMHRLILSLLVVMWEQRHVALAVVLLTLLWKAHQYKVRSRSYYLQCQW